ncbi:MAG: hypothetical protein RL698_731 [Pseudomonadota bacterium]
MNRMAAGGRVKARLVPALGSYDEIRARLLRIAESPSADLAEGALLIAAEEYPDLDLPESLDFLDDIAASAAARLGADAESGTARVVLTDEIFRERGFAGDADDYYDPRNSLLSDVIERRRGIPITLSIVYVATAQRIGQRASGVNAPGHFLVRHGDSIIDAFRGGREVGRAEFAERLREAGAPDPAEAVARLLAQPPTHREILSRVLGNLKATHLRRREMDRALADVDRLVLLNPDQPAWLRERAALYQHLGCPHAAIADLERFCELAPRDPERDVVRQALAQLVRNAPAVH